jgi:hypothetical protein
MARNWFADPAIFLAPRNLNIGRWTASVDEQTRDRGLSFIPTALSPSSATALVAGTGDSAAPVLTATAATTASRHDRQLFGLIGHPDDVLGLFGEVYLEKGPLIYLEYQVVAY